ncbi:hypothetical protein BDR03DRAFT_961955 [Suillus americanus]|nr:hypothetical protein BDR03DRAFT_961955 [Suillus americanus]
MTSNNFRRSICLLSPVMQRFLSFRFSSSSTSFFTLSRPCGGSSSKLTVDHFEFNLRDLSVESASLPSLSPLFTPISLPSCGVNSALRPLLESPVELPAGLWPRKELLLAKSREGMSDCVCDLDDCGTAGIPGLEEGTTETRGPDGGRDILPSNTLGVEGGRVLYKAFEDPQLALNYER